MESNMMTQGVPAESWAKLAQLAGTTPEEFKTRYESMLTDGPHLEPVGVNVGEAVPATNGALQSGAAGLEASNDCLERTFDVSLFKVVGVSGKITLCGLGTSDWMAQLHLSLDVAGSSVWSTDYTLSARNSSVCFSPDLFVVKGRLCVGLVGSNLCFNINGNICYWGFGWQCADFNQTLFCFK